MSGEKHALTGTWSRTATLRLCYEIFYALPDIIHEIEKILTSRFGCTPLRDPVAGPDQVIVRCDCRGITLEIGWDNWSGFYIFSDTDEGDLLVKRIGEELDGVIGGSDFERFIHFW